MLHRPSHGAQQPATPGRSRSQRTKWRHCGKSAAMWGAVIGPFVLYPDISLPTLCGTENYSNILQELQILQTIGLPRYARDVKTIWPCHTAAVLAAAEKYPLAQTQT